MKTIRTKITVWFSTLFMVLVIIVLALLFLVARNTVTTSTQNRLRALVGIDAESLQFIEPDDEWEAERGGIYYPWGGGLLEVDGDFLSYANGVYVSLYSGEEFLYGEDPIGVSPGLLPFADDELRKTEYGRQEFYVFDVCAATDGDEGLWLRGVIDTDEDVPVLLRVSLYILLVLPVLAVVTIYGGYQLAKRALNPLYDISSQANSIVSGSDLTQRIETGRESEETRLLADAFNAMFERLHRSFEAEKQFTSDVSHELRTPVAVISAECEYALSEQDPAEWREALSVISRQNTKMSHMIEDMLTFTRLERGTIDVKWEEVDLGALAREVCEEQRLIWKRDIAMHAELDEGLIVRGDRGLLERMIRNLVSNAYQYGKEPGNIWVWASREDGRIALSVRDDGIGIREEDLPKIWDRFYRAGNARQGGESTGLGLSMVRQIALLHGAQAEVSSKIGEGSRFLIYF